VERGEAPPGGTRCFGYTARFTGVVESEARLLLEARNRLYAGESVRGICEDWEGRCIATTAGKRWYPQALKRILSSATLSAQREREGRFYAGRWPAIFAPSDTEALRALFATFADETGPHSGRKSLLTWYLRCGVCGGTLTTSRTSKKVRCYICANTHGADQPSGVLAVAEPLENVVSEWIFSALVRLSEGMSPPFEEPAPQSRHFLAAYLGDELGLRRAWSVESLEWKRAVVGACFEHLVLMPAILKGRQAFDPKRLVPTWRLTAFVGRYFVGTKTTELLS
jgi:hypothetical protein